MIVAANARPEFYTKAGGTLNIGTVAVTTLVLNANSSIGGELGGTIHAGAATTVAGNVNVDVYGSPPFASPSGAYTLVSATSGLGNATDQVGKVYNDTNFTVTSITGSDTAITVNVSAVAPLTPPTGPAVFRRSSLGSFGWSRGQQLGGKSRWHRRD